MSLKASLKATSLDSQFSTACKNGDLTTVKDLVSRGADNYTRGVLCASFFGHLEIIKYLGEVGANIEFMVSQSIFSIVNKDTKIIRYAVDNSHLDIIDYLVSLGADKHNILIYASHTGNLKIVKHMVGLNVNIGQSFYIAARYGHLDIIKYFTSVKVKYGSISLNFAVSFAENHDHFEVVKYLVSIGAPTVDISKRALDYLLFCKKMEEKRRIRAQKKIYFWWIQICYDLEHHSGCGKRMALKNLELFETMMKT